MKHTSPRWFQFVVILILAFMCTPLAMAAVGAASAAPPITGSSLLTILGLAAVGTTLVSGSQSEEQPVPLADAIAAIEDKTMPMSQRLGVALKALQGVDPTNQLADIKSKLDTATAELSARDKEITDLKAAVADLQKQLSAREQDVASADEARAKAEKRTAELEAAEKDIEKRAESKSKEKLGALGFPSAQAPAVSDKPTAEDSLDDLRTKFRAEEDPAKKSQLARQIRQAEDKAAA